jgi:hypothetical protein
VSARFGFELLAQQATDGITDWINENKEACPGDSPIEKLLYCAIVLSFNHEPSCRLHGVYTVSDSTRAALLSTETWARQHLLIEPQAHVDGWRVDFLIRAWTGGAVWTPGVGRQDGKPRWRSLVAECDGHDFHERTKEQAARDRARDRGVAAKGYDVFRFTGSELWRDPMGCAEQVLNWAERGIA